MRARSLPLVVVLCSFLITTLAPGVQAEVGHERFGYPVNVDGDVVWPYIPSDLAERHPDLVAQLLADGVPIVDLLSDEERHEIAAVYAEDLEQVVDGAEPLNKFAGLTAFPYYPLLTAELTRLAEEHPGKMRLTSAGNSRAGLDLWLVEIADFDNPDRVPLDKREVVYLDGGTHSNEYSGVYFVTEWLQFLLDEFETNETARWIVENRHTFVLPMVNPDGSNAFGRVNAIDVNINRNFPGTWGTVDELPVLNWPGPWPASEPETQAVIRVLQEKSPDFVQSTHCCGNLWLHPYGAEQLGHAPDFEMYTNICENVFPDLTVDVERKRCGETWSTIYPASGTTLDEGYSQVGASSWSYEMSGRGKVAAWGQPVVDTDVRQQEIESWRGVMHGFLNVERYGALPRVVEVTGTSERLTVTVENQGWGQITEATLRFGAHAIALPALEPGQQAVLELSGDFAQEEVPVEIEWKKRMHPDSNWGRKLFDVQLAEEGGALVGLLPEVPTPPSMDALLPDLPDSVIANMSAPEPIHRTIGLQGHLVAAEESPALGAGLAAFALLGACLYLVRRR